jgi:hypothetical protein
MTIRPQRLRSRDRVSRFFKFGVSLVLTGLFAAAAPQQANAAEFAVSKNICAGVYSGSNACPPAEIVGYGPSHPVFYVITVANLPGQPQQDITLTENYPSGFNPGAVVCTDQSGNPVPYSQISPLAGTFTLAPDATVTCIIAGTFSSTAGGSQQTNTVVVKNNDASPTSHSASVTTSVSATTLNADLVVTKTLVSGADMSGAVPSVGVGTSYPLPATVTFMITIKNNGPDNVDLGKYFVLHDNLALRSNSVALYGTLVPGSFTCSVTAASGNTPNDCLSSTPSTATYGQQVIGTMAQQSMFDWGYAPGSQGHLEAGATMTLTYKLKVDKLPGITCTQFVGADGLINQVFFTLLDTQTNTAESDIVETNNTSAIELRVNTGYPAVDGCGEGQLTVTKKQVNPSNPVAWGSTVTYVISVKNTSFPQQPIKILPGKLEDIVVEGVGTPPFTRTFIGATCTSVPVSICAGFNGVGTPSSLPPYSYYGQGYLGWASAAPWSPTLQYGQSFTITIKFKYSDPDCTTVPVTSPEPIDNVAQIFYTATAVGGTQMTDYVQTATAHTFMQPQQTCRFRVTKRVLSFPLPKVPIVHFGDVLVYQVDYTNEDAPRQIGTVMDALRITSQSYATQVPFSSTSPGVPIWTCTSSTGVTGFIPAGPNGQSGLAIYTTSPAQGTVVMQQPPTVFFPTNSTLTCTFRIKVKRPAYNNPRCSMNPADFENLALMDVTHPYNSNAPWPPSANYDPSSMSNPTQQKTANWATIRIPLPKCYSAIVNKSASVNGVSPAWTWGPAGPAVDYDVTVTNTGTAGTLTGAGSNSTNWNGLKVKDWVTPTHPVDPGPGCTPSNFWCNLLPPTPASPTSANPLTLGIAQLPANSSGHWHLRLLPQFTDNSYRNCVQVVPSGTFTGPDYYSNYAPANPPPIACIDVPVLHTATLNVTKKVVNQTGQTVTIPYTQFSPSYTCGPYPVIPQTPPPPAPPPMSVGPVTLPNSGSINSLVTWTFEHIPVAANETCTVTEVPPPVPASASAACGPVPNTLAYWDVSFVPSQPISVTGPGPYNVTVVNTLKCSKPRIGSLTVIKNFTSTPTGLAPPGTPFAITVQCVKTSPSWSQTYNFNLAASGAQAAYTINGIPIGASCDITEVPLASFPHPACFLVVWQPPAVYSPPVPIQINGPSQTVHVTNNYLCQGQGQGPGSLTVTKVTSGLYGWQGQVPPGTVFDVNVACSGGGPNTTLHVPDGGSQTITGLNAGTTCTLDEPTYPSVYCVSNGAPLFWVSHAFVPSSPIPITGGAQTVILTNNYGCHAPIGTGSLTLIKTVAWEGPAIPAHGPVTFKIHVDCVNPAWSQTVNISANDNGSFQQTLFGIPDGAQCTIDEVLPPTYPSAYASFWNSVTGGGCTWHKSYPLGQQAIIDKNHVQTLQIVNNPQCTGNPGDINVQVYKTPIIDGKVTYSSGMTFNLTATCNGSSTGTWTAGAQSVFSRYIVLPSSGAPYTCHWEETLPLAIPSGYDPLQCHWVTKYYYNGADRTDTGVLPAQSKSLDIPITAPTGTATTNWLDVQNQLVCNGNSADITPVTGRIRITGSQTGPAPLQCKAPLVPNKKRTACVCPEGTEMKDGKCVKKSSVLEDIMGHVTIGVGVGGGSSGGGGKPPKH